MKRINGENNTVYIYKITNLVNGKIYIGKYGQGQNKFNSYWGSGLVIKEAIIKYGKENFKKEIIIEGKFNESLTNDLEKHYIRLYNSNNKKIGYNLTEGGEGFIWTEEQKQRLSIAKKGKKLSEITKQKLRESYLKRKDIPISEETRKKISKACLGRKHSVESKEKIRASSLGRKIPFASYQHKCITVHQYTLSGKFIKKYASCGEAGRQSKIDSSSISKCAKNKLIQTGGYIWVYNQKDVLNKVTQIINNKYFKNHDYNIT